MAQFWRCDKCKKELKEKPWVTFAADRPAMYGRMAEVPRRDLCEECVREAEERGFLPLRDPTTQGVDRR